MHGNSVKVGRDAAAAAAAVRRDNTGVWTLDEKLAGWEKGNWASRDYDRYLPCAQVASTRLTHHERLNDTEET